MKYKTQNEFLFHLEEELKYLKPKELNEVIKFYRNKISIALDYGEKEEKILMGMPEPQEIAKEIYQTKGISYLDIRKKQLKKRSIFDLITSILVITILLAIFGLISFYFFKYKQNIFTLLITSFSLTSLDKIVMIIFIISYLILSLFIFIYIIDLFYLLISYFLVKVLDLFNIDKTKKYEFANFTISGFFAKICKVDKILLKGLVIACLVTIVSYGTSYFTKGYIYNSSNNIVTNTKTFTYNLDEITDINDLIINQDRINLTFVTTEEEKFIIEYKYQFDHNLITEIKDQQLTISLNNTLSYDLFNILQEPTDCLVIKLPKQLILNLNVNTSSSDIILLETKFNNIDLNIKTLTSQIYNSQIDTLKITSQNGVLTTDITRLNNDNLVYTNKGLQINNCSLEIKTGSVKIIKLIAYSLELLSSSTTYDLEDIKTNSFKFNARAGEAEMKNITCTNFNYYGASIKTTMSECIFDSLDFDIRASASLTLKKTLVKTSTKANISGSYFITEYFKTPLLEGTADSANVFLNNINDSVVNDHVNLYEQTYNEYNIETTINLTNTNNTTFAIINTSKSTNVIKSLNLIHEKGEIIIKDANITNLMIEANDSKINFTNVYGDDYQVKMKDGSLSYYNDEATNQKIKIKCDILTQIQLGSNIIKEE